MKKCLASILCVGLAVGLLTGCGTKDTKEEAATEDEENYETGDASLDNPRNQDDIGQKELLVVSFGTSFNDSRRLTIGAIEDALEEAFPDWSVRRAFTSQIIIDHVKERDGEEIDNVKEALDRAVDNGVKELLVQPTHLMNGLEYNDLMDEIASYSDAFDKVYIGEPLLTSDDDFEKVKNAICDTMAKYDDGETAICFMGHGTEAESNGIYARMQELLTSSGIENFYVGTVEATPTLDDVIALVKKGNYKRVVLRPLMVVAGDHANNDMAGDEEDSWKSRFEAEGYEVEPVVSGLGEIKEIRDLYVEHAKAALGDSAGSATGDMSQVADASEMTEVEDVVDEGMTPVTADMLKKGTYEVGMRSSSSMFKVDSVELNVLDGDILEVKLYMHSNAYSHMYIGTAEEAAKSGGPYLELQGLVDTGFFDFPIEALDQPIQVAAFSVRKQKWYDRTILFEAASLPEDAFLEKRSKSVDDLGLADGSYTCSVTLDGGSGKASVTDPCNLTIKDGKCIASIEWSSDKYDYMMVDGVQYDPVNTSGNSVFEIPVDGFDYAMKVQADTTAMSKPYLIDYTLTFDSSSIR